MVKLKLTSIVINKERIWIGLNDESIVFIGSPNSQKDEIHQFIKNSFIETVIPPPEALLQAFKAYFEEGTPLSLSYSIIIGTPFQQQVWQLVSTIPYGETLSYSEVAEAIGKPMAVRSVASAVARNPLLLLVPCHRVIQKSGKMGDYRGGVEWKQTLLTLEKSFRKQTV